MRQPRRIVALGSAGAVGASSDLRTVLNYLLVADFKAFGRNTDQAITLDLKEQDPEVAALRR